MAKVNVYSLKRPYNVKTETKTFEDPLQPGESITLTLKGLTPAEQFAALDFSQSFIAKYIGSDDAAPSEKLPAIDGRIPVPSPTLCMIVGRLVYAQSGTEGEAYTFEELIGVAELMPNAFTEIQTWSEKLLPVIDPKGPDSEKS